MNNSPIENNFIKWCQYLHPDINAYIFIQRYSRYSEEYLPLLSEFMTQLHQKISNEKPNINFSFKCRVKSKRSFLIKTFKTLAENVDKLFSDNESIEKFFKFLKNNNTKRFNEIKNIIDNLPESLDTVDAFRFVFNKLNQDEKDKLITRLGRTEDAFAYRPIVTSVDFDIKSVIRNEDGSYSCIDSEDNVIPIHSAIKFSKDDIVENPNGTKDVVINGKKHKLNERNLLYSYNVSARHRSLDNALVDADGMMTLLEDSLIINKKDFFDISSITTLPTNGDILVSNPYGESKNLSLLLNNGTIKLRKVDSEYTIPAIYDISSIINDYYDDNDITQIYSRFKDYIKKPKPDTDYQSLHMSSFNKLYGFTIEAQVRNLDMEDDCKNESTSSGHDQYKKEKSKNLYKNPILNAILKQDELAFDSSTQTLLKLLDSPDIELSEILGKYILITTTVNGVSASYQPTINTVFEHTFEHSNFNLSPDDNNDAYPPLKTSSYKEFIKSRKLRNEARYGEKKIPDFYE